MANRFFDATANQFFPEAGGGDSTIVPPADTIENVAADTDFSDKTFGAFTDPDGIIDSYEAVYVNTVGATVWSGIGLGPYSATGEINGSSGILYLKAKDAADTEVARAIHSYYRAGSDVTTLPAGVKPLTEDSATLYNGATITDGVLSVDGSTQYAEYADNADYDVSGADNNFMWQMDFTPAAFPQNTYAGLIKKGPSSYATGYSMFFLVATTASNLRTTTNGANSDYVPNGGLTAAQKYRIRVVFYDFPAVASYTVVIRFDTLDGSGNPENGFPVVFARTGATLVTDIADTLIIGGNNGSGSRWFNGDIENVVINNDFMN